MESPNRIKSWAFWNHLWFERSMEWQVHEGVCPICDGIGEVRVEGLHIYCLCNTIHWETRVSASLKSLQSSVQPARLEDLEIPITNGHQLEEAIERTREWAMNPYGYLIFSGPYGVGKTHFMRWLANRLYPIALYLTASDFNVAVHSHRQDDTLADYVNRVATAPILLFDDWGMEYGGKLVETQFAHIVDTRDRDTESFPMAIATNKSAQQIMSEPRVGSRLMNVDKRLFCSLQLEDHRLRRAT